MNSKNGFTLIELIIVIVILAILIAVALPRFVNFEEQAENAVLNSTLGALRSTARIAESRAVADGFSGTGDIQINNENVYLVNNFPVARSNDISANGPGTFSGILELIELEGGIQVYYSDDTEVVSRTAASDDYVIFELRGKCFTYRPPQLAGELPEYSSILAFDELTDTCS